MSEAVPDRCDDCGGLLKPSRHFDQAMCKCEKRRVKVVSRFHTPREDEGVFPRKAAGEAK